MAPLDETFKHASSYILGKLPEEYRMVEMGIVCGSGLNNIGRRLANPVSISYSEIPGFPEITVEGHGNRLLVGPLNGIMTVCMMGRFHYYEGHSMEAVTFPLRVLALMGITSLIVTNASGSLCPSQLEVGDIMVITDHISFPSLAGINPLCGANLSTFGPRFLSTTNLYHPDSVRLVQEAARLARIPPQIIKDGIYCNVGGPSYETRAELALLRLAGGSAVGMSTVPEVLVAAHSGISKIVAIALISNVTPDAKGDESPSHQEVLAITAARSREMELLVEQLALLLSR